MMSTDRVSVSARPGGQKASALDLTSLNEARNLAGPFDTAQG